MSKRAISVTWHVTVCKHFLTCYIMIPYPKLNIIVEWLSLLGGTKFKSQPRDWLFKLRFICPVPADRL